MYIISKTMYKALLDKISNDNEDEFDPLNINGEESFIMGMNEGRRDLAKELVEDIREFK